MWKRIGGGFALAMWAGSAWPDHSAWSPPGFGTQCNYFDYPSCQRAAAQPGGPAWFSPDNNGASNPGLANITIDPNMGKIEPSPPMRGFTQPFCMVSALGSQCWYMDVSSCQRAAASANGACVVNSNR
jgi:hypothetical protein